jgi:hypothetical protein
MWRCVYLASTDVPEAPVRNNQLYRNRERGRVFLTEDLDMRKVCAEGAYRITKQQGSI